jgi:hypothetical protein
MPLPSLVSAARRTWRVGARCSQTVGLLAVLAGCTGDIIGGAEQAAGPDGLPQTPGKSPDGVTTPDGVGWATRFPKLSNEQWENTVSDLFYLDAATGLSEAFSPEPADGGYDNEAAAGQTVAGDSWARYQLAAEALAKLVTSDAQKLSKLVPSSAPTSGAERARATIVDLGLRTYRRPLTSAEVDAYVALFDKGAALDSADAFRGGMNLVIQTMLQSPHFLYRVESSATPDGPRIWLNGFELATRLSYALWNTTPPRDLLDAAAAGQLGTPEGLKGRATSMLADPRGASALARFHEQTFRTGVYGSQGKDAKFSFDPIAPVLKDEARLFFADLVAEGGGIREILTKPVAFVNEQTAPFYGLTGITGSELRRVELDPTRRAGLLSQVGFLAQTGARTLTDPVHRGLAILREVLCDDPDPPPPIDIQTPVVPPGMTTRETYEKATACGVGCHNTLINPPGFAFEHFDTVGRWRDDEGGLPLNVTGTFGARVGWTPETKRENPPIMLQFDGAVDLVTQLAELDRTHECYARHLLEFVLAKPVDAQELGAGALLGKQSKTSGTARSILSELVTLNTFRARAPDPQ